MTDPLQGAVAGPPREGLTLRRERPEPDAYLALYRAIGEALSWDLRTRMTAQELDAFLHSDRTVIWILRDHGEAVGLCEFDGLGSDEVELVHFGIVERMRGAGVGRWFLDLVLRRVWLTAPGHVWLHTDENDDPAALPLYLKLGFRLESERIEQLDEIGLRPPPWRGAAT